MFSEVFTPYLTLLSQGKSLTSEQILQLLTVELASPLFANAFNITRDKGLEKIKQRLELFHLVYPSLDQECHQQGLNTLADHLSICWQLWLPLSLQLATRKSLIDRPFIQGILGGQGTGKTTLTRILSLILSHLGYKTIGFSLDDLYLNAEERQAKCSPPDPRYFYRGVPGTHQVDLGIQSLEKIRNQQFPVGLPRFDKSYQQGRGRQIKPQSIENLDILLFEGWFVGVRPIEIQNISQFPPPIITESDRNYAKIINKDLQEYLPLWQLLDSLIILYPTDYRLSQQWRKEAEQKMKRQGKEGMTDTEIEQFVIHFWQSLHPELFITPLTQDPHTDLVIEIQANRHIGNIYKPCDPAIIRGNDPSIY